MMNTSESIKNSSALDCGINHHMVDVLVPSLYFIIFILALVLNITVMWVLLRLKTESTLMVYLKNLVAADLLMTLMMPIKAASKMPWASLGLRAFACRFANVLFYHSMYNSIILMGLISLERFFQTVRPCGRLFGERLLFGRVASISTWVVLLAACTLPTIILTSEKPSPKCMEMKTQVGRDFHQTLIRVFNALFWVVLVQTVFCYAWIASTMLPSRRNSDTRGRRNAKANGFIVLVVFLVCFAPYHIVRVPYTELQVKGDRSCAKESMKVAKDFTLWLSTTNVLLDPLIYFFLYKGFREKLLAFTKSVFHCC